MKTILARTIYEKRYRRRTDKSISDLIRGCGANTGNVCFVDALEEQLDYEDIIFVTDIGEYPDYQESIFVVPAANWLNTIDKFPIVIADVIKNTSAKVLLLGVGIQMTDTINTPQKLIDSMSREAKEAWHIISNHSDVIGCRGYYTVETFRLMNINNAVALGCPSFYIPYLKMTSGIKQFEEGTNIYGQIKNFFTDRLKNKRNSRSEIAWNIAFGCENVRIIQLHRKFGGVFVCQSIWDIEELEKFGMRNDARLFFENSTWGDYLTQNILLSIGPRFHGNMMAFINGIPALWINKDARTREMIEYMRLPSIEMRQLERDVSVSELVSRAKYDNSFYENYITLSKNYINILDQVKVNHKFKRLNDKRFN